MLHIAGINYESTADAEGVACTIFFSGCKHFCNGCHSKDTWDFNYGKEISNELINVINYEIDKRPFLSALVLSGGDPMYSAAEIKEFILKIHIPNNNIWCYTGYTLEELEKRNDETTNKCLKEINVLVDGKFEIDKKVPNLRFKGSTNQRILDVPECLAQNKIISWDK